ncbi:MAG: phosphatidylglycerol lysyltransferase domain-containing protein [Spirochaetaceae bacterium]|jgi:hypothetical protein|nr:phosphatidylglycerol lysyltransferase domain-containing protein [Spirochaetaceae bacterium]
MKYIPEYPAFSPLSWEMYDDLYPSLNNLKDGISEFTFPGLFLFRFKYNYHISRVGEKILILTGEYQNKTFFSTPGVMPEKPVLDALFDTYKVWKNIPPSIAEKEGEAIASWGYAIEEDRNNFDYLYDRKELAELSGKKFHKKKNLVNSFVSSYQHEIKPLDSFTRDDALSVLDQWRETREDEGDYRAAKEALQSLERLPLTGIVVYVDGKPAGWTLGETIAAGTMFAVHYEKGLDDYHGIYQFVNQAFAASLPDTVVTLNREQDMGEPGMRQAKMTYRPCGFVQKCTAVRTAQ